MTTFGSRLQGLMKHNNVTQQELANKLNVRRGSVSNWVTDRRCPDSETLVKIANYFDVTVDYLLKDNEDTKIKNLDKEDLDEFKNLYSEYSELSDSDKNIVDLLIKSLLDKQKDK